MSNSDSFFNYYANNCAIITGGSYFNGASVMDGGGIVVDGISIPDEVDLLLREQAQLNRESDLFSDELNEIVKTDPSPFGGASDRLRKTSEYIDAKKKFSESFERLREFNGGEKGKKIKAFKKKLDTIKQQRLRQRYESCWRESGKMAGGGEAGIPARYKSMGFSKVGQKKKSTRPQKKWMVLAKKGDKYKVVHGGQKGMEDFSQHHDKDRQKRFWHRMGGWDSEKASDPFSPLYWHKRFGTWDEGGLLDEGGDFVSSEKSRIFIPTKITKDELQSIISGTREVANGNTIQSALAYIRREEGSNSINRRTKSEIEKERLIEFIALNNLWYDKDFNIELGRGGEHIVYEDPNDEDFVLKTNNLSNYHFWSDYLINLLLNNTFFPATSYELIGFKKDEQENILPVVRQHFVPQAIVANLKDVQKYLFTKGFAKIHPLSNAYRNWNLGIMIGDLHDRNVLVKNDTLFFIDTKFFISPNVDLKK